ncbi:alcohol dehydrogenase catalytic domain-containing protein [Actinomadura sp. LD22]|uniref:Alcohol dehydrogenase catalytic domain-containing protein n=1 Tax=Actinomadura physcomitrii TaxID=2650748 RepID=A0A6I4MH97_9ACTN|nr:2,3-butanediol dehydrogenase [Actinomadura physcomitrii]MWA01576.1 alcohol dehydrogenase catalytic domain-containing protein [Actinomadura physcomitrii]
MRALRLHGSRDLRLDDIPEPQVRSGTVKLKVEWNGICGTDLHHYQQPMVPDDFRHPLLGDLGPHVQGHEFSGRVVQTGPGVTGLPEGTLVAVEPLVYDGTCPACRRGDNNLCDSLGFIGLMGGGGGLSEYAVVPADRAHPIPDGISAETAALVEPLSVAWHAVRRSGLGDGGTALIVGAGPIGLGLLLAAKAHGAAFVAVSEVNTARRGLAALSGADLVLDPAQDDVVAQVRRHVPAGVEVSFEASGAGTPAVSALLGALAKAGRAVAVSQGRPVELDPDILMLTEINYTGSFAYNGLDFPAVIQAIADQRLRPDALISDRIALDDAPRLGYEALLEHGSEHVKILVHP